MVYSTCSSRPKKHKAGSPIFILTDRKREPSDKSGASCWLNQTEPIDKIQPRNVKS